jgi:hypothetical protein
MRESFTSGTVGGALGNQRIYPELNLLYGLGKRNIQWPGVLDLTSEPKMF